MTTTVKSVIVVVLNWIVMNRVEELGSVFTDLKTKQDATGRATDAGMTEVQQIEFIYRGKIANTLNSAKRIKFVKFLI